MSAPTTGQASWTRAEARIMLRLTEDRARLADGLGLSVQATDEATEAVRLRAWLGLRGARGQRIPVTGWPQTGGS